MSICVHGAFGYSMCTVNGFVLGREKGRGRWREPSVYSFKLCMACLLSMPLIILRLEREGGREIKKEEIERCRAFCLFLSMVLLDMARPL